MSAASPAITRPHDERDGRSRRRGGVCIPSISVLTLTVTAAPALARQSTLQTPAVAADVAFVRVNVIPMDRERVELDQTVLVRRDRIVAVGPAGEVAIPEGSAVVEGSGRYLLPGLTDAHVHITTDMPWAPARPDFGEAPLYLAYGITTIVNLHGKPAQLEWKRRVADGELLGPTIYTSGDHVNEPRVHTPAEAKHEVEAQARAGYDVIKFHEVWNPATGQRTRTGLSRSTYLQMNDTAREIGIPLVGHAPRNLGFDALLQGRQSLAHMEALFPGYFFPVSSNRAILFGNAVAVLILLGVPLIWVADSRVRRGGTAMEPSSGLCRVQWLTGWLLIGALLASALQLDEYVRSSLPRTMLLGAFCLVAAYIAALTMALVVATVKLGRQPGTSMRQLLQASLVAVAGCALVAALAFFWVPAAWRYTDRGIGQLARSLHEAGITVQTTLIAADIAAQGAEGWKLAQQDPAIEYLTGRTRRQWRRLSAPPVLPREIDAVTKKLTAALHREGVLLVAGSDAMGRILIPPGSSLHRELQLLTRSGLTAWEAVRTATVNPSIFLGRQREFGTIAVGMRADLLLVDGNPLEDLDRLKHPLGVMVRGRWLTREELQEGLAALASTP